ncbi:MAG: hypothetical protein RQ750_12295 [Roseovarius sp.]|nr:hypothetical protein [Roseovarius sp.]
MTPTERGAIRKSDEAQHRKVMDLYRADLEYHQLGRMAQHFEALDPPRRVNVLATLRLILAALVAIAVGVFVGNIAFRAITGAVAVQIEDQNDEN